MAVGYCLRGAPGPLRDGADAGVGGVQVVGGAFEFRGPAVKIGAAIRLFRCAFAFRKGGKDVRVVMRRHRQRRLWRGRRGRGRGGRGRGLMRPLRLQEGGVRFQSLQRIGTQFHWTPMAAVSKKDDRSPVLHALGKRCRCQRTTPNSAIMHPQRMMGSFAPLVPRMGKWLSEQHGRLKGRWRLCA